jgi:hypothetical protein
VVAPQAQAFLPSDKRRRVFSLMIHLDQIGFVLEFGAIAA